FSLCHATPPPDIYTLSLHDALPILRDGRAAPRLQQLEHPRRPAFAGRRGPLLANREGMGHELLGDLGFLLVPGVAHFAGAALAQDRKSTRLNSSHVAISYAVFCLKK